MAIDTPAYVKELEAAGVDRATARACRELRLMPVLFTDHVAPALSLRNEGPPPYVDCTRPALVEKLREDVCPVT